MNQTNEAAQGAAAERELFEQWLKTSPYTFCQISRLSNQDYVHPSIQGDWIVWQAARASRASAPNESMLRIAATAVVREALDEVTTHPCDAHDDAVRAQSLYGVMADLYAALKAKPSPHRGVGPTIQSIMTEEALRRVAEMQGGASARVGVSDV